MELTGEQRDLRDAVRGLLAQQRRRAPGPDADPDDGDPGDGDPGDGDPDDGRSLWRRLCGEIGRASCRERV